MGETYTKVGQVVNSAAKRSEGEREHSLEQGRVECWMGKWHAGAQVEKESCVKTTGHTGLFKAPECQCNLET